MFYARILTAFPGNVLFLSVTEAHLFKEEGTQAITKSPSLCAGQIICAGALTQSIRSGNILRRINMSSHEAELRRAKKYLAEAHYVRQNIRCCLTCALQFRMTMEDVIECDWLNNTTNGEYQISLITELGVCDHYVGRE
jgi:hypothetical protein